MAQVAPRCVSTLVALVAVSGCLDWDSLKECSRGACDDAGRAEGGTSEAGAGDAAGEAGTSCPGNLLDDPGFENGTSLWSPFDGASRIVVEPGAGRNGSAAAKVCFDDTSRDRYGLAQDMVTARRGDRYGLSGWMRTADPVQQTMRVYIVDGTALGGTVFRSVAADWQRVELADYTVQNADTTVPELAAFVAVYNPPAGSCFYLDDACLVKLSP